MISRDNPPLSFKKFLTGQGESLPQKSSLLAAFEDGSQISRGPYLLFTLMVPAPALGIFQEELQKDLLLGNDRALAGVIAQVAVGGIAEMLVAQTQVAHQAKGYTGADNADGIAAGQPLEGVEPEMVIHKGGGGILAHAERAFYLALETAGEHVITEAKGIRRVTGAVAGQRGYAQVRIGIPVDLPAEGKPGENPAPESQGAQFKIARVPVIVILESARQQA